MKIRAIFAVAMAFCLATAARAEVKLPAIFADHMVLQCGAAVAVWGTASPGEKVDVEFAGQAQSATADANGKWLVNLQPLTASAQARELRAGNVVIRDVLVGEVWLCSGQSNMEWALGRSSGGTEAIAASGNAQLRLCTIPHNSQMTPAENVAAKWAVSGPDSTKFFSAIGWWFGSKLQKELGVPVGIINDSYGGTQIQHWMPIETLRKGPWPQDKSTDLALARADFEKRAAAATTPRAGKPGDFRGPSVLWNGMVAPLRKFRVRGVAWYQGESNGYVGVADTYAALLGAMIADWRAGFERPDLPFVVFQISAYRKPQTDANEASGMAQLREAQLKTVQNTAHTALVVTLDLGEPDVHYKNKEPAADRAVKAALALAYGRDVEAAGPMVKSMEISGGKAVIHFTHTAGGLMSKGGALAGFVMAGADRKFVFADARIEGDSVIVSSAQVAEPVAVRYGWADLPRANLFSQAGLPASPFRTDDWPIGGGKGK